VFNGVNKVCQQCVGFCKQWRQATLVSCPSFRSTQKKVVIIENEYTLPEEENGKMGYLKKEN